MVFVTVRDLKIPEIILSYQGSLCCLDFFKANHKSFPVSCVGNANTLVTHLTDTSCTFSFYVEERLALV